MSVVRGARQGASTATVEADQAETRLDRFLRRHHPGLTQGAIEKLCRTGQVRVDGKRVEASKRLAAGQTVRIPPLPDPAIPKPRQTVKVDDYEVKELTARILYRDADVLVIDKQAGLATQGGKGIAKHLDGMLDALRFEADERPRLVHRLDRDTSGVLVLARNAFAAGRLAASFRGRDMEKTYWAIVVGLPVPLEGQIDLPLARIGGSQGARTKSVERDAEGAARAITEYRTIDHAGRKFSWLELQPLTGRTHQLRAHCAALGTPILGDAPYGEDRAYAEGFARRLHLHARRLVLPHPRGGTLTVEADLPAHMKAGFAALGFHAEAAKPAKKRGKS
ncbi:RluA family pseudouridine synthase [Acidiphilium sp. AL]|uniref:Pseudouridine synthase n=1 Tax=Acidiphilium iwatense TaxID=768198 RepID=A0ABS9DU28_9PROT|nr:MULTISPECIES: RluA family pseudouridine synthase [Acidiphilium]MCF3946232.1 RluA family pseudouridine synthase [Acidiphilium iwatense]MCU4158804.1 RluA family pseudouridine synthase [Acidiphilium sp. AL]